jgi:hypothetical protein
LEEALSGKGSEVHSEGSKVQRFRGSKVQRFRGSEVLCRSESSGGGQVLKF